MSNRTDLQHGMLRGLQRAFEAVVPIGLVLVPLVYAPFFSDYMIPKQAVLSVICAILVGLWGLRAVLEGALVIPVARWLWPLALYLVLAGLSTLQAANLHAAIEEGLRQVLLWAVALSVALHYRGRVPLVLCATLAIVALAVSVLGMLQYAGVHLIPSPHERYGNLGVSTFGNTNFVAHYLEIAILVLLGAGLASRIPWQRAGLWFVTAVCGYYMLMIQSRGGWIALCAGLCCMAWGLGRRGVQRFPMKLSLLVVAVAAVLGEFALRATYGDELSDAPYRGLEKLTQQVIERVATLADTRHISIHQRRLIWADTADMIEDRALWGVGLGNYAMELPAYRTVDRHKEWQPYIGGLFPLRPYHAHNEYMEVWAESGLGALLAWIAALTMVFITGWRVAVARPWSDRTMALWGMLAALFAAVVHACFSFNLQDPTSSLHFWVLVGLVEAQRAGPLRVWKLAPWQRGLCVLGALVLLAGSLQGAVRTLWSDYYYFQGQRFHYVARYPNRAYLAFARAAEWNPNNFRYQHMLGLSALDIGRLVEAETALRRSIALYPNSPEALRLLGRAFSEQGRADRGVEALRRARQLDPLRADGQALLARALASAARLQTDADSADQLRTECVESWEEAVRLAPENAEYISGWGLSLSRLGALEQAIEVMEQAERLQPNDAVVLGNLGALYLQQGRLDRAEAILERATQRDPLRAEWWGNLALLFYRQERWAEAERVVAQAVAHAPDIAQWHVYWVEILLRQGKVEEAWHCVVQGVERHPDEDRLTNMALEIARLAQREER